jgi:hypothetical protein
MICVCFSSNQVDFALQLSIHIFVGLVLVQSDVGFEKLGTFEQYVGVRMVYMHTFNFYVKT